ncbi:MAG: DUF4203 domain-containing protein [Anaerolineales bacterium]|jgi:hypothetical protein|nr:DUF4203 domain-containing protein [Anaerolineales bacterium]
MLQIILFSLLAIVVGAALILYGYRIFLVLLPVFGFFAGFWVGASAMQWTLNENFLATLFSIIVGVVLGIIFAIASYAIYFAGVAVVAFAFGAMIAVGIMTFIGFEAGAVVSLAALAAGVLLAIITFQKNLQKYFIMGIMSLGGGNLVVLGILVLIGQVSLEVLRAKGDMIGPVLAAGALWVIIWLGLAIAGLVYQIRTSSDFEFSMDDLKERWG